MAVAKEECRKYGLSEIRNGDLFISQLQLWIKAYHDQEGMVARIRGLESQSRRADQDVGGFGKRRISFAPPEDGKPRIGFKRELENGVAKMEDELYAVRRPRVTLQYNYGSRDRDSFYYSINYGAPPRRRHRFDCVWF